MKYGKPQPLKQRYYKNIEKEINRLFYELIFSKLEKVLEFQVSAEIKNSISYLKDAISEGRVWYDNGQFHCEQWNAKLSRELKEIGATFNPKSATFSLPSNKIPVDLKMSMAHAELRYSKLKQSLIRTLDDMNIESIDRLSDIPDRYFQTIEWMNEDWEKTIKAVGIPPQLSQSQRGTLAAEWGYNLDKYIKDWAAKDILKLRGMIETNAFEGQRISSLVSYIQENFEVSKRKAEFLARQETSLLLSKFHEVRYRDVGIARYRWSTSNDERVREDHKLLNNEIFSWDQPPVVDRRTGRRANPGEDFGCRCVAIPIIE